MTTARHLEVIDLLRVRDFPAERGRSGTITSGPGYHVAELSISEELWDDDGSRRLEAEEQYEAECEALAERLSDRWGAAQMFSLWSVLTRSMEGEEIAEPWDGLSNSVSYLHLWRVDGRWVAVGVSQWDTELEFQLMAVVTEIDPP
ncbi:hypothetical protein [Streptomyces sp. CBMA152]|uniref:hypothetical protein n=1 Tax=Streptomyces sp. CBMA152 TaxID=1896312 RepID=UPI00166153AF|nr:hypothetical protein [Streptomyces sp. CBMA152]MBD0743939.1 hypothetical protein [Streptomyces sp. CBMA152]